MLFEVKLVQKSGKFPGRVKLIKKRFPNRLAAMAWKIKENEKTNIELFVSSITQIR